MRRIEKNLRRYGPVSTANLRMARQYNLPLHVDVASAGEFSRTLGAQDIGHMLIDAPSVSGMADILVIDPGTEDQVTRLAADNTGKVRLHVHNARGKNGSSFYRFPLFPMAWFMEAWERRSQHADGVWRASGEDSADFNLYRHTYFDALRDFDPARVRRDHLDLESRLRSMPIDLMKRWPKKSHAINYLIGKMEQEAGEAMAGLEGFVFMFLREDALVPRIESALMREVAERFTIFDEFDLDEEQARSLIHANRGGNWMEHDRSTLIAPVRALVTRQVPERLTLAKLWERWRRRREPREVTAKRSVRQSVNLKFPDGPELLLMHSTDGLSEAWQCARLLFPENADEKLSQWRKIW